MVDAVKCLHLSKIKRIHAFKTTYVVATLVGVNPPLVMRVNAAIGAEVVLGGHGVELVELQCFLPFDNAKA